MPRDSGKTKQKILDAAQQQVLERGFGATSVDAIQAAAGISRGTFFYHYPSKDHLARALIERYADEDRHLTDDLMARAEKLASDPLQQALLFLSLWEELFQESGAGEVGCLFASYSYEAGLFDEHTHALIVGSIEHWREVLGGKLKQAMRRHPPRAGDTNPYLLADFGYGVLQGAFILGRTFADPSVMVTHLRQFRRLLEVLFGVAEEDEGPAVTDVARQTA
jgi:TetR/AcrR family transcriptional repressor of nem operon